jgi:hypothetical protein
MLFFPQVALLPRIAQRLEFRIALLTTIALLIAQLGAMSHAYSHVPSSAGTGIHQSSLGTHEFCNDCLGFAPLLSAAAAPAALPQIEPQGRSLDAPAAGTSLLARSLVLAFRSRAPPAAR